MKPKEVYYVRHKETGKYLDQRGSWLKSFLSYGLAKFDAEAAATAAIPAGAPCEVIKMMETTRPAREENPS